MDENIKKLNDLAVSLYGNQNVTTQWLDDSEGAEITIIAPERLIKNITINIYKADVFKSYMHLDDDFTFEIEDEQKAFQEFEKYLTAIADNKIQIKGIKLFGVQLTKKIVIINN